MLHVSISHANGEILQREISCNGADSDTSTHKQGEAADDASPYSQRDGLVCAALVVDTGDGAVDVCAPKLLCGTRFAGRSFEGGWACTHDG